MAATGGLRWRTTNMNSTTTAPALCLKLGSVQHPSSLPTELTLPNCDGLPGATALNIVLIARLPQQAREVPDPNCGEFADLSGPSSNETKLPLDLDEPQKLETLE
ncbi:hypothetical protein ES703_05608 [subsurface metagenome]